MEMKEFFTLLNPLLADLNQKITEQTEKYTNDDYTLELIAEFTYCFGSGNITIMADGLHFERTSELVMDYSYLPEKANEVEFLKNLQDYITSKKWKKLCKPTFWD